MRRICENGFDDFISANPSIAWEMPKIDPAQVNNDDDDGEQGAEFGFDEYYALKTEFRGLVFYFYQTEKRIGWKADEE